MTTPSPVRLTKPLLREIGEGCLFLGGDGQGLEALENDPVAQANRPRGKTGGFDTSHLSRYEGTNFIQWHGRKADGRFYPYGSIMQLTRAGIAALKESGT